MADDTIKNKIRALLAKAQSTDSEAEANLFLTKAQELMERHQLELFDLHIEDPIGMTLGVNAQPGPPSYKSDVQCALARYYGARPIIWKTGGGKWTVKIVGPESARVTTELMTDFVWKQVCEQGKKLSDSSLYNRQEAIRHVAKALCHRIRLEIAARKPEEAKPGSSLSLVVIDAIESWMDNEFGDSLTKTRPRPKSLSTMVKEAAKGISLHHQTGDRNQLRLQ